MEKYARQAIAEGVKNAEDIVVTTDSELYRVLNLHYNRNNQIEVRLYYWLKLVEKKNMHHASWLQHLKNRIVKFIFVKSEYQS